MTDYAGLKEILAHLISYDCSKYVIEIGDLQAMIAENEALHQLVSGKVVCDLELFQGLRDTAAQEADEHRQCMAAYRPQRQEVLDAVVRQCDELINSAEAQS
jgi:hypothetical protein